MFCADETALATSSSIGLNPPPTLLVRVDCVGTEINISQCPQDIGGTCIKPGAGLICPNGNSF